ncbi:MAG: coproporphyrinogen III oxidase family protein [Candidatus Helarchaeota archaeon]|nr:coproporphyrinogen III oxidase family protein [Candidatus Helarchaeota archaeon]
MELYILKRYKKKFIDSILKGTSLTKLFSIVLGFFVRREGKKFQVLDENIKESDLVPSRSNGYDKASLYVHIPFCRTLCPYCSFNRYRFKEDQARIYFENLNKELDLYIQRGYKFSSVYFGGGTPTIKMDGLLEFIDHLKENNDIREISVESTPREINEESVNQLKAAGVNRISVGVQSFDRGIMKVIGRLIIGKNVREKIQLAKDKFDTLNLDLMFNFPTQTIEHLKTDLEILKSMKNDFNQVTFYPLMPSPHKKVSLERRFNRINTSRERKFYEIIQRTLLSEGYRPSTVWCFSYGETIIDEYIIEYDDYIGLGSGSVSLLDGTFYVNSFSLDRYDKFLTKNKLPIIRWKKLTKHEQFRYYFLTKLFGMEINTNKFYQKFKRDIHEELIKEIFFLKFIGLIREKKGIIQVTERGMYYVNMLMREFYGSLNALREFCIENQV